MTAHAAPWPKVVGAVAIGFAIAGVLSAWRPEITPDGGSLVCECDAMLPSLLLLVVGYFVAAGREWARRLLIAAVVLSGLVYLGWEGYMLLQPLSVVDHLSAQQAQTVKTATFLRQLSSVLIVLIVVVSLVLLLFHRDVVASFRNESPS